MSLEGALTSEGSITKTNWQLSNGLTPRPVKSSSYWKIQGIVQEGEK